MQSMNTGAHLTGALTEGLPPAPGPLPLRAARRILKNNRQAAGYARPYIQKVLSRMFPQTRTA
jgi:hypothetical protein